MDIPDAVADLLVRWPRWSLTRWLLYVWFVKLTGAGRALMSTMVVSGTISAAIGIQYPMHYLALALLAVLFVSRSLSMLLRPRCRVQRRLPPRVAAGAQVVVRATVTNLGRLPAFDVGVHERSRPNALRAEREPEQLRILWPGEAGELTYRVRPAVRGLYELPGPLVYTTFPFGLYRTARAVDEPQRLLVYPTFSPLAKLSLPAGRRHQPGGLQLVSQVGDSEEYIGNRDYRAGDRLRDLDHRAWARQGAPVVREYRQEYLTRIALVVDTFVPLRIGDRLSGVAAPARRQFEAAISLGAAVADALSRMEYVVDLFAIGPSLYRFTAGRHLAFLDDVLDVLACIELCTDDPFPTLVPEVLEQIGLTSTAVIVLLDWDEARQDAARALEERGLRCKLVVVRDGPTTLEPPPMVQQLTPADVESGIDAL